jgi:chromosome segregation protein
VNNEQRVQTNQVQPADQVLAADQPQREEQSRALNLRLLDKLTVDRNALNAPDETRLLSLQSPARIS